MGIISIAGSVLLTLAVPRPTADAAPAPRTEPVTIHAAAPHRHGRDCLPEAQLAALHAMAALNRAGLGLVDGGIAGDDPPPYRFYPMAGRLGVDTFNGGFVDLDPSSPEFHDYACRAFTYDGHQGIDTEIRSFAEQFIGVPVYAARDGVVILAQDGYPDTNIFGGVQGNIVFIDHGDGFVSEYYHLKLNSVAVSLGQIVTEGEQIGMVGSSGNSFGPHLHFQIEHVIGDDWTVVEPFAGACRPGASDWLDQAPLDSDAIILHDFGITRTDLSELPDPWWHPWPLPTDGQIALDDPAVVFWWRVFNFPEDCLVHVTFVRPNGSIASDAAWNWGNPEVWRIHKNWFAWDLAPMGPVVGTWRILFELDGTLLIDAPFEVVATVDPDFNRAPEPVVASFNPAAPEPDDLIRCEVACTPAREDLDWDVVRYRYVWRVDGDVVRDVTTAAQSDVIPRGIAPAGATLDCAVTPNDGTVDGPTSAATVVIAGAIPGDLDGDGHVTSADLAILLGAWGSCTCAADLDGNGVVDSTDLSILLANWG